VRNEEKEKVECARSASHEEQEAPSWRGASAQAIHDRDPKSFFLARLHIDSVQTSGVQPSQRCKQATCSFPQVAGWREHFNGCKTIVGISGLRVNQ
jgi:hypothetical protein